MCACAIEAPCYSSPFGLQPDFIFQIHPFLVSTQNRLQEWRLNARVLEPTPSRAQHIQGIHGTSWHPIASYLFFLLATPLKSPRTWYPRCLQSSMVVLDSSRPFEIGFQKEISRWNLLGNPFVPSFGGLMPYEQGWGNEQCMIKDNQRKSFWLGPSVYHLWLFLAPAHSLPRWQGWLIQSCAKKMRH